MPTTLYDKINEVNASVAQKFAQLSGDALKISAEGIIRHFRACERNGSRADPVACREIIEDALQGRRVFAEVNDPVATISSPHGDFAIPGAPSPYDPETRLYEISRDIGAVSFGTYQVRFS